MPMSATRSSACWHQTWCRPAICAGYDRWSSRCPPSSCISAPTCTRAHLVPQHEAVIETASDPGRVLADAFAGHVSGIDMLIPSLTDPSLAPAGEHVVILKGGMPQRFEEMTPTEQDRFAELMLELAEQVLPNLRDHLTHVEGAGSGTTARFPLHRLGPIYGWAFSPQQSAARRLSQRTPVKGPVPGRAVDAAGCRRLDGHAVRHPGRPARAGGGHTRACTAAPPAGGARRACSGAGCVTPPGCPLGGTLSPRE